MIPSETTIGWIGAGKMGLPICLRLKEAGFNLRVLGRNAVTRKSLEDAGFIAHDGVANLVADSDIVFSSVSDDIALNEVVHAAVGHFKANATFIDISTVSPQLSAKLAELLKGIPYLRSPVSGSTAMAQTGTLTAVVSGPKAIFEAMESVFAAFTRKSFHVGKAEEARYLKLVLNSMVAATSALLAEALAFGQKGGLDNATMLSVINQSAVASPLIAYKTDMIVKEDYQPAATLSMLQKDLHLLLSEASANATQLPLAKHIHDIYQNASARGLGEKDFFVLVQDALEQNKFPH
jgi:3-hydroxyisobutyrate dehydrogenase-like beta-hydroxyacid dehydrogenase